MSNYQTTHTNKETKNPSPRRYYDEENSDFPPSFKSKTISRRLKKDDEDINFHSLIPVSGDGVKIYSSEEIETDSGEYPNTREYPETPHIENPQSSNVSENIQNSGKKSSSSINVTEKPTEVHILNKKSPHKHFRLASKITKLFSTERFCHNNHSNDKYDEQGYYDPDSDDSNFNDHHSDRKRKLIFWKNSECENEKFCEDDIMPSKIFYYLYKTRQKAMGTIVGFIEGLGTGYYCGMKYVGGGGWIVGGFSQFVGMVFAPSVAAPAFAVAGFMTDKAIVSQLSKDVRYSVGSGCTPPVHGSLS
jgi:hypothetical protein